MPDPSTSLVINLPTPLYQKIGGNLYKVLLETVASQVLMSDGVSVENRLITLERAFAGKATAYVVEDIAERDALLTGNRGLIAGDRAYVKDASGDDSVESGGAQYLLLSDMSWHKISEDESMDLNLTWEMIEGKPQATVDDIDQAVIKQHVHTNKDVLDEVTDDGTGNLLYKGKRIDDGMVEVACVSEEGVIPPNLRDGGLLIINPAGV